MSTCVVVQPIAAAGLRVLAEAGIDYHVAHVPDLDALRGPLADARAVITRNLGFSAAMMDAAPDLRVVSSHGTGVDAIDVAAARARGIVVTNTAGTNARSVAEHTIALMLACARRVVEADAAVRSGRFDLRETLASTEVCGRTLGIVGWGHIGSAVARLAAALGMEILVHSRRDLGGELALISGARQACLQDLLAGSDVVSLHAVPGSGVRIDAEALSRMRPGAILINTARGALVDEDALVAALRSGRLAGAGLDVFTREPPAPDGPLLRAPRIVLTPHVGGSSREALERTAVAAARNVVRVLRGSPGTA